MKELVNEKNDLINKLNDLQVKYLFFRKIYLKLGFFRKKRKIITIKIIQIQMK